MLDSTSTIKKLTISSMCHQDKRFFTKQSVLNGIVVAALGAMLTLSGCATKPIYQNTNNRVIQVNNRGVPNYYKVKSGDTVSQIANRYGLNYRQVGAMNHLDSRYTIYVGQLLKLWEGGGTVPNYNTAKPAPFPQYNTSYPTPNVNVPPNNDYMVTANSAKGYGYPSSNQVVKNFDADTGTTGMWFTGSVGDPVVASKAGQVLYAGNGLPEYGNLIMIRHDSKYITAYAHNDKLLVKEGDNVAKGQRIATMGSTGQINQVALEFQLRENGTPIDPRAVLGF